MIEILPLQPHQIEAAKYVITAVAQRIFEPDLPVEEFYEILRAQHELKDVDEFQQVYFDRDGIFLVVLDDGKVIGTGALKRLDETSAELKRLWLLETYHGQGLGYRVVTLLFDFARQKGYKQIRLKTSTAQERAIAFYKKLGFYEILDYGDDEDDLSFEILL